MSMPFIRLDRSSAEPLADQIARQWTEAILAGTVRPGERLPTVRDLAEKLEISLETVQKAYRRLQEGGWVESRPRFGTVVKSARPASKRTVLQRTEKDRLALLARIKEAAGQPGLFPVSGISLPPEQAVADTLKKVASRAVEETLRAEAWDPFGLKALRSRVQGLLTGRGIWAEMASILITGGSQQALSLIAEVLLGPRDVVGIPAMCYLPAKEALAKTGARIVPVLQDERGIDPGHLEELCRLEGVTALYAMPTAHYPTGETWDAERKREVLELAARRKLLVVEDDYFGELHHGDRPPATLWSMAGMDGNGKEVTLVYTTSFSTVLHPNLRMGVLLVPERLAGRFARAKTLADGMAPALGQQLLLCLWEEMDFPGYLANLRKRLRTAGRELAASLERWLPGSCRFRIPEAGVCGWVDVPPPFDGIAFFERCLRENLFVMPDIAFALAEPVPGFQVKFGHLPSHVLDEAIRRVGRILAASPIGHGR